MKSDNNKDTNNEDLTLIWFIFGPLMSLLAIWIHSKIGIYDMTPITLVLCLLPTIAMTIMVSIK